MNRLTIDPMGITYYNDKLEETASYYGISVGDSYCSEFLTPYDTVGEMRTNLQSHKPVLEIVLRIVLENPSLELADLIEHHMIMNRSPITIFGVRYEYDEYNNIVNKLWNPEE